MGGRRRDWPLSDLLHLVSQVTTVIIILKTFDKSESAEAVSDTGGRGGDARAHARRGGVGDAQPCDHCVHKVKHCFFKGSLVLQRLIHTTV